MVLVNAPEHFKAELQPLPADVRLDLGLSGHADVILAFYTEAVALTREFSRLAAAMQPAGGLWITWPKKASGVATDLNENVIRDVGLAAGLVDNKVCAVSEVWSGLRFVYRLKDRPRR